MTCRRIIRIILVAMETILEILHFQDGRKEFSRNHEETRQTAVFTAVVSRLFGHTRDFTLLSRKFTLSGLCTCDDVVN